MSLISSKDCAIYYEEHGSGEPLILLPGLLGTIESHWRRFIPDFARHFHVIAVDLRGHGRTNNPSRRIRLHQLVADLFSLYETLQIDSARICGYSLGGYVGLAFGIQHPGRVQSLLMHATKFYWTHEAVASTVKDFDAEKIREKVPQWAAQLQQDHAPANGDDGWKALLASAKEFIETMPAEGLTENAVKLAAFPVLVSAGDSDEMIPRAEVERLAAALPNGKPDVLLNTRHPMQHVQKTPFLELAIPFLRTGNGVIISQQAKTQD
ncbi:MAG: alpha/beta fold hydrolase [Bacteroidetes bacterium]|nr:alpha/beta fold hydrolase [Bacteroidota bacterium]MCW5894781.1 alpha/beta fold hydrolase [Bacteroidota bacterium]